MKENLKRLLYVLLLAVGLLSSCNREEDIVTPQTINGSVTHSTYTEVANDYRFKNVLAMMSQNQNKNSALSTSQAMAGIENLYGIDIAKQSINITQKNGKTSYTMLVNTANEKPNEFKNLIIQTDADNQLKATVLTYQNNVPTKIETLVDDSQATSRVTCYKIDVWECNYPGHTTEGICTHGGWVSHLLCLFDGSGSGSGGGGGGDSSGGGGGNGGSHGGSGSGGGGGGSSSSSENDTDADVVTAPVLPDPAIAQHAKKLLELTKNNKDGSLSNIMQRINDLKIMMLTHVKENGGMFDQDQNILRPYNVASNETRFANGGLPQYYVIVHMHQNEFYPEGSTVKIPSNPIMSDTDVEGLLKLHETTGNKNVTSILVTRQGTFALRVTDREKAKKAREAFVNSEDELRNFEKKYDALIMTLFNAPPPMNEDLMFANFVNLINTYTINGETMGLTFYQAVYDRDGNIIEWVDANPKNLHNSN